MYGTTIYTGTDSTGRYHATDDRDALPPDLVSFNEGVLLGDLNELLAAITETEASGTSVLIQIGDFYHETDDEA